jgi:hypothetical protein
MCMGVHALPSRVVEDGATEYTEWHWPISGVHSIMKVKFSVWDPDPQDPHVFGPPGSESISQRYGSGSRSGSGPFLFLINVLSGLK